MLLQQLLLEFTSPQPPNYFSIGEAAVPSAGFSRSRELGLLLKPVLEAKVSGDRGAGAGTQILPTRAHPHRQNFPKVSSARPGQAVLRLSGFTPS